jgi:hypothetical protein
MIANGSVMSYSLIIRERGHSWAGRSPVESLHGTQQEAHVELLDYVRRNWDAEFGTEPPEDAATMIAEYFADVLEAYEITETTAQIRQPKAERTRSG